MEEKKSKPLLLLDEFNEFMNIEVPKWHLDKKDQRFMERVAAIYKCAFNNPKIRHDYRSMNGKNGGLTDFETICPITEKELKNKKNGHNYHCENFPFFYFGARLCCERDPDHEQAKKISSFFRQQFDQVRFELGPWSRIPTKPGELPVNQVYLTYSEEEKKLVAMVSDSFWSGPYISLENWFAKYNHKTEEVEKHLRTFIPSDSVGGCWFFRKYFNKEF